jgi:hypothetical protein
MEDVQIILAALWASLMLTYLWGDVLSIFAGDSKPGEIGGKKVGPAAWFGIAIVQLIPIIMIFLSLVMQDSANRWINIIVACFLFIFNLVGLRGYKAYHKFLIIVGLVFLILIIGYAWNWEVG